MHGLQHVPPPIQPLYMYPKGRICFAMLWFLKAITAKVVTGVFIIGGALDAKGTALWACKLAGRTDCPNGGATVSNLCFLFDQVKFCLNLLSTSLFCSIVS